VDQRAFFHGVVADELHSRVSARIEDGHLHALVTIGTDKYLVEPLHASAARRRRDYGAHRVVTAAAMPPNTKPGVPYCGLDPHHHHLHGETPASAHPHGAPAAHVPAAHAPTGFAANATQEQQHQQQVHVMRDPFGNVMPLNVTRARRTGAAGDPAHTTCEMALVSDHRFFAGMVRAREPRAGCKVYLISCVIVGRARAARRRRRTS
jgi:hypothetical protein